MHDNLFTITNQHDILFRIYLYKRYLGILRFKEILFKYENFFDVFIRQKIVRILITNTNDSNN